MKVLILYQEHSLRHLLYSLCDILEKQGIMADSFNITNWQFRSHNGNKLPLVIRILKPSLRISKIRGLLLSFLRKKILMDLAKDYSIIDIHQFDQIYDELIPKFYKDGKHIKVTLWGSDFYKTGEKRRNQLRGLYYMVGIIQTVSWQMHNDFIEVFPEYSDKMRVAHFGVDLFDLINKLQQNEDYSLLRHEFRFPEDKTIIACGCNGSERHQHHIILNHIESLTPELKENIFLLLPMTYGGTRRYIREIDQRLKSLGISYKLIAKRLSVPQMCKLRIASDIVITIQKSDGFSAAIQEHIYAGSLVIAGNWLPYFELSRNGIYFVETDLDALTETISDSLINLKRLKSCCINNKERMSNMTSWDAVQKDWNKIYEDLFKSMQVPEGRKSGLFDRL